MTPSPLAAIRAEVPALVRLAVPLVAGLAASTLLGVTDSLMLAPLGEVPLAAVGLTGAVAMILYASVWGLLSAISVRVGAAWGAGQGRRIALLLRNGLALGWIVGVLGACVMMALFLVLPLLRQPPEVLAVLLPYWLAMSLAMIPFSVLTVFKATFEAIDRPWTGAGFALLAVVINVPLNYALIWGLGPLPALGLTGAGIASLLAEGMALLAAWAFWRLAPSMRRLRLRKPLSPAEIASALREGAPLGILYVGETGAMSVATLMIGTFGALALAGNQVALSLAGVLYMVPLGMAGAVAIRVAQIRGAANAAALRPVIWAATGLATGWLVGSALLLAFGGRALAALVTEDPAVIAVAASILGIFALSQVMDGVQSTLTGALRGLSDTGFPAVVSTLAYWVLGLPLGWVLANQGGMGPAGVWLGFVIALSLACAPLFWRVMVKTR